MSSELVAKRFIEKAEAIARIVSDRRLKLTTAESCTGGGIAAALTAVPGSSSWFECGVVSYSNESKTNLLGVPPVMLSKFGAVSCDVVEFMANSIAQLSGADLAISASGIAGPGGGSTAKPVGTVWIGWYILGAVHSELFYFPGNRDNVRGLAVEAALNGLYQKLNVTV